MAGYSSAPLFKKLGIKERARLGLIAAPDSFASALGELPMGVSRVDASRSAKPCDVLIAFVKSEAELRRSLPRAKAKLAVDGGLWLAWPKKASGVPTDLTEDVVREHALALGLVDNKVCAIDEIWSGLRVVYRLADRPKLKARH